MSLDRDAIVQAALDLIDEVGIDGLSTRVLAARLGIRGPSLYWHFKNKRELLDYMAEALLAVVIPPPPPDEVFDFVDWLGQGARGIRLAALSRRDGARLLAGAKRTGTNPALSYGLIVGALKRNGLSSIEALTVLQVLGRFAAGWVLHEQAGSGNPAVNSEAAFEFGLQALLRGIEEQFGSRRAVQEFKDVETTY